MSTALAAGRMTLAEFDALPDDPEVDRMLLLGELLERPATVRNHRHAEVEAAVAGILRAWRKTLRKLLGKVFSGEVGCDLPDVDSRVGSTSPISIRRRSTGDRRIPVQRVSACAHAHCCYPTSTRRVVCRA